MSATIRNFSRPAAFAIGYVLPIGLFCLLCFSGQFTAQSIVLHDADSLHKTGQDAGALDAYRRAAQLADPCVQVLAYQGIGRIHRAWNNPREAEIAFGEAMRYSARCHGVCHEEQRYDWALSLLAMGRPEEAVAPLENLASSEGPFAQEALDKLAHIAFDSGDFSSAAGHFQALSARCQDRQPLEAEGAFEWAFLSDLLARPEQAEVESRVRDWIARPNWSVRAPALRCARLVHWAGVLYEAGQADNAAHLLSVMPQEAGPGHRARAQALTSRIHDKKGRRVEALIYSARSIESALESRDDVLIESLARWRMGLLKREGRAADALAMLTLADSLATASAWSAGNGPSRFWEEPFIRSLGDARTALWARTEKMQRLGLLLLAILSGLGFLLFWGATHGRKLATARLKFIEKKRLPAYEKRISELSEAGLEMGAALQGAALSPMQRRSLDEFTQRTQLYARGLRDEALDLNALCASIDAERSHQVDWTVTEETSFSADTKFVKQFLSHLLERIDARHLRVDLKAVAGRLEVVLHDFSESHWWPQAVSLFTGDNRDKDWSLVRMRCDRLGGSMQMDCDANGARQLRVVLPVGSVSRTLNIRG